MDVQENETISPSANTIPAADDDSLCSTEQISETDQTSKANQNEDENLNIQQESDSDDEPTIFNTSKKAKKLTVMSDDEEDGDMEKEKSEERKEPASEDEQQETGKKSKKRIVLNEDSDSENEMNFGSKPANQISSAKRHLLNKDLFTTEDSSDEETTKKESFYLPSSSWKTEEEEEEQRLLGIAKTVVGRKDAENSHSFSDNAESSNKEKVKSKKVSISAERAARKNEMEKIHSESQRLIREGDVSLPYHKPKQKTLADFLNRRKRQSLSFQDLKMNVKSSLKNKDVIESLAKQIEERKKDVIEFYKSESESEEEKDDKEWTPDMAEKDEEKESDDEELEKIVKGSEEKLCSQGAETMEGNENLPETETMEVTDDANKVLETQEEDSHSLDKLEISATDSLNDSLMEKEESNKEKTTSDVKTISDDSNAKSTENDEPTPMMDDMDDEFIPGNDDVVSKSIISPPRKLDSLKLTTQDLEGEGLGDLMLLDEDSNMEPLPKPVACESDKEVTVLSTPMHPKLSKLASKLGATPITNVDMNSCPRVPKLNCEGIIDLDSDFSTMKSPNQGLADLISRFAKHSAADKKKSKKSEQVNMRVVSKEKGADGKETLVSSEVTVNIEGEKEDMFSKCDTPGGKLQLLKQSLRAEIAQQRAQSTKRRQEQKNFMETEDMPTGEGDDPFANLPDEEEEEELSDESEAESEPEENDVIIRENKRSNNEYLQEEAEESDQGEDEQEQEESDEEENDDCDSNDEEDDEDVSKRISSKRSRASGRMIVDSDNEEDESLSDTQPMTEDKTVPSVLLHTDASFELTCIPGHQPQNTRLSSSDTYPTLPVEDDGMWCAVDTNTATSNSLLPSNNSLFPLTAGNSLLGSLTSDNFPKSLSEDSLKLDFSGITSKDDVNDDDLAMLCTGNFTSQPNVSVKKAAMLPSDTNDSMDLLGLCTGTFTDRTPKVALDETVVLPRMNSLTQIGATIADGTQKQQDDLLGLCSGTFKSQITKPETTAPFDSQPNLLSFFGKKNTAEETEKNNDEIKNAKETNEEEKSRNEEAKDTNEEESDDEGDVDHAAGDSDGEASDDSSDSLPAVTCYSVDDQTAGESTKKRRIVFMDDEDANFPSKTQKEDKDAMLKFSGFVNRKKVGGSKIRAEFLEAEAELSGSEAGSDDEEDVENDEMEEEEGDKEHFDEEQLRDEVGQDHWRTELAQDQREVRLLQELYLEDGELHGEGRQRTFRWKNLDKDTGEDERRVSDSEDEKEEEDDEESVKWRQQRFEREQFMKEMEEKGSKEGGSTITPLDEGSFLKPKARVISRGLRRNNSLKEAQNTPVTMERSNTSPASAVVKKVPLRQANPEVEGAVVTNSLLARQRSLPGKLSKCGSFLQRGASKLARLATLIKERNDGSQSGAATANSSGNFVFSSVTAEEAALQRENNGKTTRKRLASDAAEEVNKKPTKRAKVAPKVKINTFNSSIFKHF